MIQQSAMKIINLRNVKLHVISFKQEALSSNCLSFLGGFNFSKQNNKILYVKKSYTFVQSTIKGGNVQT